MSDVQAFAIALAGLLSGLVAISAWLFRVASAPLAVKLVLPTLMLACGLFASERFSLLLGRPVPTTLAALPARLTLIAFKPIDNEARVDLWVSVGGSTRAYEIPLDDRTKRALREARERLARGQPVTLSKSVGAASPGRPPLLPSDPSGDDRPGFVLDPIQSTLPRKD